MSINTLFSDTGILKSAQDAGDKMGMAVVKDKIEVVKTTWYMDYILGDTTSVDDFFDELKAEGIIDAEGSISGPSTTTEADGTKKDVYEIETKEGYVVEIIVTEKNGKLDITIGDIELSTSTAPKISITEVTSTETSITVKVEVTRLNDGKITYSYREQGTEEWTSFLTETTETTATVSTGITANKMYEVKAYAQNSGGNKEATKEISTDKTVPQDATASFDKTTVDAGEKVTATVTLSDAGVGVDVSKSKYVFKKSNTAITDESEFTKTFSSLTGTTTATGTIEFTPTEAGDWYLQVLTVDKGGNKKITVISQKISVTNKVTGISLNKTTAEIGKGETLQLTATVTPENASNKEITWSSSSTSVATVSQTGLVTAVGKGETTITATAADGSGKNASCTVTVSTALSFTGATNTSDSYVGYYADINGDGEITEEADGIIFADKLRGGSGQWFDSNGAYSIGTISSAKSYKVSSSNYTEGKFGSAKVLQANGSGADRFYVMALKDLDTSYHRWYYSAYSSGISDYNTVTSADFGTGKTNTSTMITKWNNSAYGSQNGDSSNPDVWGVVQTKNAQGWFVPSRAEWAAFGDAFNITTSNDSSTYGLSNYYWSSSLNTTYHAWLANFNGGCMNGNYVNTSHCVRLCATF